MIFMKSINKTKICRWFNLGKTTLGARMPRYPSNPLSDNKEMFSSSPFLKRKYIFKTVADWSLGKLVPTKTDEFSEKFQTAVNPPPPSFSENHVADFL